MKREIAELIVDYEKYYLVSLKLKSKLAEMVQGIMRDTYLESFAKHKDKFFMSNYSFLTPSKVCVAHYDPKAGKNRRRSCYLSEEHLKRLKWKSEKYDLIISLLGISALRHDQFMIRSNLLILRRILQEAKFPESVIPETIDRDLKAWRESVKLVG